MRAEYPSTGPADGFSACDGLQAQFTNKAVHSKQCYNGLTHRMHHQNTHARNKQRLLAVPLYPLHARMNPFSNSTEASTCIITSSEYMFFLAVTSDSPKMLCVCTAQIT